MGKKLGIIIGIIILGFMVGASVLIANNSSTPSFSFQSVVNRVMNMNFDGYDKDTVLPANDDSGSLPEKIEGDPDKAKVIIYEYADYACSHCAEFNSIINKIVKDSNGKVAVVFRNYLINYFKNNVIAASAATAADIQGYWAKYKDLLFEKQDVWYNLTGSELRDYLIELFNEASDGQGDTEKFDKDLNSESVARRVAFEFGIGAHIDELTGTPYFRINGEAVAASDLRAMVEALLAK